MITELVFESPINALSMGNVGFCLLRELYKKGIKTHFLPISPPDASAFTVDQDFANWLQSAANSFHKNYRRDLITLKNWHIHSSHSMPSDKRYLLTYHETDSATEEEINILKNLNKVFFCGDYSKSVFDDYGLNNVESFNLGFDNHSFFKTNKKYFDDRATFLLAGKLELRKHTLKILQLWAKKFGNNRDYYLNCAIVNPHYDLKQQEQQIGAALNGVRYWNITFHPYLKTNAEYNELLNCCDIDLTGLSGSESWNLPAFNMTALGKWSIVLNVTGHKTWANADNAILVNANGKIVAEDGIFFHKDQKFNKGNFYSFSDEEVLAAFEKSLTLVKKPNLLGEQLIEKFSYKNSLDNILNKIEN